MRTFKQILFFFLTLLLVKASIAQSKTEYEKLKTLMWSDPDFNETKIPDKWKNESAVILAKNYEYEVRKEVFANYVYENIYLHKRVKLNDKSAVNTYSELSFESDYRNGFLFSTYEIKDISVGIKVVKSSGKENIIDLKDAVINQIKAGYNKREFQKIAIPDLEPGDIVDYFYCIKNTYVEQFIKILDPVYYSLVEKHPIVKQKFNVRTLRQMYFNSKSINGAPALTQTDKEDESFYSISDKDREKGDDELWTHPLRVYPIIKFQAYFIHRKALAQLPVMTFFLKDKKSNNSSIDIAHMEVLAKKIFETSYLTNWSIEYDAKEYLKKNFDKTTPNDTIVKYLYYFIRSELFTNSFEGRGDISSNTAMICMSNVLKTKKIKHDFIISVPNHISDISDLILPSELSYVLRIKSKQDYYIGDFNEFSLLKSIDRSLQGNTAYAVSIPIEGKKTKAAKITLPIDSPEVNKEITELNAKFVDNKIDSISISIDKSIFGNNKYDEIRYAFSSSDYKKAIEPKIKTLPKGKEKKKKSKSEIAAEKKEKDDAERNRVEQNKVLKERFKEEYGEEDNFKIQSFSVKQTGLWDNSKELKYNVKFKIGNIIKPVGPNFILDLGKLITKQLELAKDDIERKTDVFEPSPRIFEYKISLEIPGGYNVKGIEKFNYNSTNTTGGFTSKAEIQNGKLIVNIKKFYLHQFEKVSEWPKMVEFIEAAYNFSQQSLLFEKK